MKPGKLYKVTGNSSWWIIIFRSLTITDADVSPAPKSEFTHLFKADIVAQSRGRPSLPEDYLNQHFHNDFIRKAVSFDVKDLPLYIGYCKSPLFDELLKGGL